jgi:hypothetical protein
MIQNMKLACTLLLTVAALYTAGCSQTDDVDVVRPRLLADGAARISNVDPLLQAAMAKDAEDYVALQSVTCRTTDEPSMKPRLVIEPACDVTADLPRID